MRRTQSTWVRIRQLKADPMDQILVSLVYLFTAILAYMRPEGLIFIRLSETMEITSDGVRAIYFVSAGLIFRFSPIMLIQYLFLLLPLIALISYVVWFVLVTPSSSFVSTAPAIGFLVVIIKNSFTMQRGRG